MSGRKNVILPHRFIEDEDMSTQITSDAQEIQWIDNIGLELVWDTADINGEFLIQMSVTGNNWQTIPVAAYVPSINLTVAGIPGSHIVDLNQLGPCKLRVLFIPSSGTAGTCNAWITVKMI
mgnify:CR=1 FL=1